MLIFVIGGAYQGKHEFAKSFGYPIVPNLHIRIRTLMKESQNVSGEVMQLLEQENCVAVCNEIGCGIVPVDKEEREYRELVGRIGCEIAKKADAVYRIEAGLPHRIKG